MDSGYLKLMVALLLAECVWSLPLGDTVGLASVGDEGSEDDGLRSQAKERRETTRVENLFTYSPIFALVGLACLILGCQDNGTSYKEGEVVRSGEPCLSCVCRRGALACSLRVCADYVDALPPGCFLVHKANDCCPRLLCEGGFGPQGIELRTAVRTEENKVEENGCVVNGTVYGEGSAVASWDPCEYCYCTEGGIKCVKPRCVQSFEGCKAVYEKFSCCPTHFDCRDAKVGFLTSQARHFGADSEPEKEDLKVGESDRSSSSSEEKTTEDFTVATTEDVSISTEESRTDHQPETPTPSSPDNLTTLRFQTTDISMGGLTEETTLPVTTDATARTEEGGEQASGACSGSLPHMGEVVGHHWNSSETAEDYDAYDYGEPELPPSLPNLVIFPFVAADAVVKDDRTERHEVIQVERTDDQAPIFKDYFSPPTRTEGGFVPKQPSPEPFYELPFPRKELSEQPTESLAIGKQTAPPTLNEASSSFDENQRTEMASEDILGGNVRRSPFGQVLPTEMGEFLPKGNSESFRKSQQTNKPVTVAYKNVVVDFYPDHLVTTTRTHSATQSEHHFNATNASQQLQQTHPTTPISLNAFPDFISGLPDGASILVPPQAAQEVPAEETRPSLVEVTPTSAPKESSLFDQFLKSLMESNTPTTVTLTTSNKHKYSSKIKGSISTTAKPKREGGAAGGQLKMAIGMVASSGDSAATFHSIDGQQPPNEEPVHSPTTLPPTLPGTENPVPPELANVRGHHIENRPFDGSDRTSTRIHSNPGTLLKLAGCNIYGMMYRIGKVITELSGPCRKCLCTDLGVQCSPLEC